MNTRAIGIGGTLVLALASACLWSCVPGAARWARHRSGLQPVETGALPEFADDSDRSSLLRAVDQSLDQLARLPSNRFYTLPGRRVTVAELRRTLEVFRAAVLSAPRPIDWPALVREHFEVFAMPGTGSSLFTGYYAPELRASRERTERFRYPIYRLPYDLVDINLGLFCPACSGTVTAGRLKGRSLLPYYTRAQIDRGALAGRDAELAWLDDPIEVFFLHVQGSALLKFNDGSFMHVSYSGSNGRPYRSVGKLLVEMGKMRPEAISLESLKAYLRAHPEEQGEIFNANERYIFFRAVPVGPIGSMGVPLTPGRSVAVDPSVYPLGSLAFVRTERPGAFAPTMPLRRFVLCQDTGAAITGAWRVDVFWGTGRSAERIAAVMRSQGEMYMLLAK